LGVLWRAVRAHRAVVALVVVATVAGSLAWLSVQAPEYGATAQVLVNPRPQDDQVFLGLPVIKDTGDPTRTIQTAAALLKSPRAAATAARRLGRGWTEARVLAAIQVQPEGESNILDVQASGSSAGEAAALANAFVAAVLAQRDRRLVRQVDATIARLSEPRAGSAAGGPGAPAELEQRVALLRGLRGEGDPTLELARPAAPPAGAEGAPSALVVVLALTAGAVLAAVAALVVDLVGPARVGTELELTKLTTLPVLARVPRLRRWPLARRSRSPPKTSAAALKSFRTLRLQLELTLDREPRVVLVSSAARGDGKTSTVVQFGQTLAAAGTKVLLVDLDLSHPQLAVALGLSPDRGLLGVADVPGHSGLSLMAPSRSPTDVSAEQLLEPLQYLLREASDEYAYVLLDTAPLGEAGDILRLTALADAVLVVVRLGTTTATDVEIANDLLEHTNPHNAAAVVIGSPAA
jgi:Mrp family chromosome partitioning ATPase/capsular polysaccharide biosynthesis protein